LVGGDINLEGATLKTAGGRIELGSVEANSLVSLTPVNKGFSLDYDTVQNFRNIELSQQATVDASGEGGGDIYLRGKYVTLKDGAHIEASTLGAQSGGKLSVTALETLEVIGLSSLVTDVYPEAQGNAPDLSISAQTLLVQDRAQVSTITSGKGNGGNLTVKADTVKLRGSLITGATSGSTGNTGDLTIDTKTLLVEESGIVITNTSDAGHGGNLTVKADTLQLDGILLAEAVTIDTEALVVEESGMLITDTLGTGNSGDLKVKANTVELSGFLLAETLTIDTKTLLVEDKGSVITNTSDAGNGGNLTVKADTVQLKGSLMTGANSGSTRSAGDLTIDTKTLLVEESGIADVSTSGAGHGGNLTIKADTVQLRGSLFAQAKRGSTGNAGDLTINTKTLLVEESGIVDASTSGAGHGGNLTVKADTVQLRGSLFAQANRGSTGNAGDLTIDAKTLLVQEAQITTNTFGAGDGGNLTVNADTVKLIGSGNDFFAKTGISEREGDIDTLSLFSTSEAQVSAGAFGVGNGGNLTINTQTLLLQSGALVSTDTLGIGNGGNLTVNADTVELNGSSALFAQTTSPGRAGDLTITAQSLLVQDRAKVSTITSGTGSGGNLTINTQTLLVRDGAQVFAGTFGEGNGGNLTVNADTVELKGIVDGFRSGLFTQANRFGSGGGLTIDAQTLLVQDGAIVSVQGVSRSAAGNMTLNAHSIRLDNKALLTANTQSARVDQDKEQATININSRNLIMSGNSNIRTNATGENVIGGNINIDTDILAAAENSDISANSANFRGGNVRISAQGIFGIQPRNTPTLESDITATGGNPDLSGNLDVNSLILDYSLGLIELPVVLADTSDIVDTGCGAIASTIDAQGSKFVVTGRGGLPPSPDELLSTDVVWSDTRLAAVTPQQQDSQKPVTQLQSKSDVIKIHPATGWVFDDKGNVSLISHSSNNVGTTSASCK
jgi:large exoprotein involved in heme utilization and adhesion